VVWQCSILAQIEIAEQTYYRGKKKSREESREELRVDSEAKRQLTIAANLGAPTWRVAYHRGLFEEASGNFHLALRHYEEVISERPGWEAALARRDGIIAATRQGEDSDVVPDDDDRR
jgi:predicted TPR repeat methyltransferase